MGRWAFESLRADPDNLFDRPQYKGAPILIAGDNFGCGSSREHAAWALGDLGIRVVIAPSYSDIFSGNAVKNGILPVVLPQAAIDRLMEVAETDPVHVDLDTQTVRSEEHTSELQSLMRISYAVFCLKKKNTMYTNIQTQHY